MEGADRVLALPAPGLLVQTTGRDGLSRLHNHGSYKLDSRAPERAPGDPLYARFAYSTRTGPTSAANAADNHVALSARGLRSARVRIHPLGAGRDWLASSHRPVFPEGGPVLPSARIESLTLARGRLELRVHRMVGVPVGTPVHHSGWAVALLPGTVPEVQQGAEVRLDGPEVTSQLAGLYGWEASCVVRAPQGTAYGPWALVPELTGVVGAGEEGTVFVGLASLTGEAGAAPIAGQAGVEVSGLVVAVRWGDGVRTVVDFGGGGAGGPSVTEESV